MDGFDDLLSRSRGVLENPFEDPFAKPRSISPDPWASFGQPSVAHGDEHAAFLGARSTTPTIETHGFNDSEGFQYPASEPSSTEDQRGDEHSEAQPQSPFTEDRTEERELHTPTLPALATPGFRESVPSPIDEVNKHEEQDPQREPSPAPAQSEPPESPAPPATAPATYGSFIGHASHPSSASTFRAELAHESPLDRRSAVGIESSFTGLSIGGEAFNGWQSEASTYQASTYPASPPTPTAPAQTSRSDDSDSSDDDRPILQSAKLANRMSLQAVSMHVVLHCCLTLMPFLCSQDQRCRGRRMVFRLLSSSTLTTPRRSATLFARTPCTPSTPRHAPATPLTTQHTHILPDILTSLQQIPVLRPAEVLRLPLAVRDALAEQPGCRRPSRSRQEPVPPLRPGLR